MHRDTARQGSAASLLPSMLPILQRRFRALENSKSAMIEQLRALPADRLSEHPIPGKWSAAELIDHIARVEGGILSVVKQKLAETKRDPVKVGDRVGSLIVRNIMRSPLRVKVPAEVPVVLPNSSTTAAEAVAEWDRVRGQWQDFLNHVRGPELKGGVFSHPRGGLFTLPETVLFVRLHHDHHRAQLTRLAKAFAAAPALTAI